MLAFPLENGDAGRVTMVQWRAWPRHVQLTNTRTSEAVSDRAVSREAEHASFLATQRCDLRSGEHGKLAAYEAQNASRQKISESR